MTWMSHNMRVSGFGLHLRPNPAYGWTSDTYRALAEIPHAAFGLKHMKEGDVDECKCD